MPISRPALSADQLAAVGVALLGHQARAGGPGVAEAHEAELGGRPEHEVLGEPGEMHAEDGAGGEELHGVVAGSHRVHAVFEDLREPELVRDGLTVHGVGIPGERTGAHRRGRRPSAGGFETLAVARQRPEVGQQQMAEDDRLGALEMRVSRTSTSADSSARVSNAVRSRSSPSTRDEIALVR